MDPARSVDRRFNLGDGMIVVAAAAVCSALGRAHILPNLKSTWWPVAIGINSSSGQTVTMPIPFEPLGFALAVSASIVEVLAICFCAFALMRLRQPRPPLPVVAAQPGTVALWAVAASVGLALLAAVLANGTILVWVAIVASCLAVPAGWFALWCSGRWAPEPSWIDRLGRILGVCWCVATWIGTGLIITAMVRG